MQNALGGVTKLSSIHDFDQSVTATTWDRHGRPLGQVRKRVRWVKPNLLRLDQVGPYDTYVLYFNGTAGWEILPDGHGRWPIRQWLSLATTAAEDGAENSAHDLATDLGADGTGSAFHSGFQQAFVVASSGPGASED